MSDTPTAPQPSKAETMDIKKRLDRAEAAIQALLDGMLEVADVTGRDCMPEGEHYGRKF